METKTASAKAPPRPGFRRKNTWNTLPTTSRARHQYVRSKPSGYYCVYRVTRLPRMWYLLTRETFSSRLQAYETLTTRTSTCVAHGGCGEAQLDTIEFCSIRGLGHTWPGSTCCTDRCLGEPCEPAQGDVPASTYMLDFFSRLPPRPQPNGESIVGATNRTRAKVT